MLNSFLPYLGDRAVASVLLLVVILLIRFLVVRSIGSTESIPLDVRRRILINTRTGLFVLFLLGAVTIWLNEIHGFALSIAGIAVAIAISMKELILCLSGSFLKTISRSFSIGDRIEVNGVRGDVIDQNFLSTTILEVSPQNQSNQYTGRAITIPNALFVGSTVVNETFTDEFVLHLFTVPIDASKDWKKAEEILTRAARHECEPHLARAKKHLHDLGQKFGIDMPAVELRILIYIPEPSRINLVIRIAVPARMKGRIEQEIIRRFLEEFRNFEARREIDPPSEGNKNPTMESAPKGEVTG